MKSQIKSAQNSLGEDTLDLKKYLFMILANWYWFVFSIFITLGAASLINRYTMPVYQVTGSLIINEDSRGRGLTGYENMIPGMEIFRNQKTVLTEIEILKSYSLANRVLSELDFGISYIGVGRSGFKEAVLYNSCPFIVIPDSLSYNLQNYPINITLLSKTHYEIKINDHFDITQKVAFGEDFKSNAFNFKIVLRDSMNLSLESAYNKYYFIFNSIVGLANNYRGMLNIQTNDQKKGSVLFLSIAGNNPQQISVYLNRLMDIYITKGLEEKNQTAINTVNFIDQQLGILDTSLRSAEMDLQDFRLENKVINVTEEGTQVFTKLESFQKAKAMAELQSRYYNYLLEYVTDPENVNQIIAPSTVDITDPLLAILIKDLNTKYAEKEELQLTVQPGNPGLLLAEAKIEIVRQTLIDNIQNLLQNNKINISENNRQLKLVDQELNRLPVTERMLISIQRQYKVNDQIYTYLLQKRAEADIAKAANVSDNKILDYSRENAAMLISPTTRKNNLIGLVLGLFFPLGLLIFLDLLNNKISSRSDVENFTSVPIVSTIGHSEGSGDIPVFENPKSTIAESFRGLRTNLQYLLREKDQKTITLSSTISGEGKTFCSINLAAIFALAGKKTLLMGLDLRKPKIHKIFNLNNSIGISTYLIGKSNFQEISFATKIENLYIIPSGPVPPNPAELLESKSMLRLLEEAKENYDIIIMDTPPFGMVTDALLISRLSDLTLIILRQNYSTSNMLELVEEMYQHKDIKHMGIIMNDIKRKGYYGYGYRYYNYGYAYKYGYYYSSGNYNENAG